MLNIKLYSDIKDNHIRHSKNKKIIFEEYSTLNFNKNQIMLPLLNIALSRLMLCMYVFFIRTQYMYNEENTPLCKWNEQQKVK